MMRTASWTPHITGGNCPTYQAIANAVAESIGTGELRPGDRLPPQRTLAAALGVDFTTVSRGYAEAQRRGLLEARVGRGTYVKALRASPAISRGSAAVDMLINHPPGFDNATLEKQLWEATPRVLSERGMDMLMRYQAPSGAIRDRLIGANWLAGRVPGLGPERVLVCPGAQGALLVTSLMLARAGDTIGVEALTYPGFILLARELGITLAPVQMDEHGARPDSLDELCRNGKLKAFYCTPIIQNPTTINMPIERRLELVEVARHHQLPIIEDDNYWPLVNHSSTPGVSLSEFPSLASLAPELVYYISGLAKCVSPALRIAYLAVPDEAAADRASVVLRATASMAAPLSAAIATYWIESGLAQDMLRAICIESKERQAIAQRVLGSDLQTRHGLGFHLWLPLPSPWTQSAFVAQLRLAGISVADSDSFAVANAADGVRLCLGAIRTRSDLEHCMQRVSDTLHFKTYESSQVI